MDFRHDNILYHATMNNPATGNCGVAMITDVQVYSTPDGPYGKHKMASPEVLAVAFELLYTSGLAPGGGPKQMYLIASPIDYRTEAAVSKKDIVICTQAFLQWLIDVKKEWVVTLPAFANKNYGKSPASLNQIALWIPRFLVEDGRVMPQSSEEFNVPDLGDRFKTVNPLVDRFEEMVDSLIVNRFAKAKLHWEKQRGFIDGNPPIKVKRAVKWM